GATAESPISGQGQVLGTIPYLAPEQVRGEAVDARSDLFSLGIILYELATGRRPFTGPTPADVSSAILRDVPVPVLSLRGDVPRDLDRIITRCLEKNARDRIQTARDVYNELRYVQREAERATGGMPAAPATPPPLPSPAPAPPSSRSFATPSSSVSTPPRDAPSIAVLPFVNRSRGEEDEYFSDGLADELLNVLTKVRGLRVAARASSFQFKGKNEDLAVIGQKLNVATLLDGSVRKAGNRVRISVQLIHASDRVQLWSETYDRSLDDIFAVQDDIAQSVVKELRTTLLGEEPDSKASGLAQADVAAAAKGHGDNPEAHRLYLQGKYLIDRMSQEDVAKAIDYLKEALAMDPKHALAWTELSRAQSMSGGYGWIPVNEAYRMARESANNALELAPDLPEAYVRLSAIQRMYDWDFRAAEESSRSALRLAPGSPAALGAAGALAWILGRFEEAEAMHLRALQQDPLSAASYSSLALLYRSAGRLADAERYLRKALELSPNRIGGHHVLGIVLAEMGRYEEALAAAQRETAEWARLTGLAYVHQLAGRKAESDEALRQLEERHAVDSPYQIAAIHAAQNDADGVIAWLERAYQERDSGMAQAGSEPVFRRFHGDPRWAALMKKLGLDG
ncbi:MAG TPA: tetratricopeptide repeat protein, partial [Candidatus Omnitrophota bacterium]|nr:tetratricopeptide repeat protein [Candidatus Omnitrophota bacterium]